VIVSCCRKRIDELDEIESEESFTAAPPLPLMTIKNATLSFLVVKVEPESVDSLILPIDHPESEPVRTGLVL
jgi:hypothetical protein